MNRRDLLKGAATVAMIGSVPVALKAQQRLELIKPGEYVGDFTANQPGLWHVTMSFETAILGKAFQRISESEVIITKPDGQRFRAKVERIVEDPIGSYFCTIVLKDVEPVSCWNRSGLIGRLTSNSFVIHTGETQSRLKVGSCFMTVGCIQLVIMLDLSTNHQATRTN